MKYLPPFHHVAYFSVFVLLGLLSYSSLLQDPPIWPDEALYADIALNYINFGYLGTDLNKGLMPFGDFYSFGYPPLFLNIVAAIVKVGGLSIFNQRVFSLAVGMSFIVGLIFFVRELIGQKNQWLLVVLMILISLDYTFSRASHISRPEIYVLMLTILSVYFFFRAFVNIKGNISNKALSSLAGLFSGLAFLTHFIGLFLPIGQLIFLLFKFRLSVFKQSGSYLFGLFLMLPIIIWAISVLGHWDIFWLQNQQVFSRKLADETWLVTVFKNQPLIIQAQYAFYLLVTFIFLIFTYIQKNRAYYFLSLMLIMTWAVSIYGKQFWYYVFPIPFIYAAIIVLANGLLNNRDKNSPTTARWLAVFFGGILLVPLCLNIKMQFDMLSKFNGPSDLYLGYLNEILENIPSGKTVFLSAIPDPYFGLKERNLNRLYEFPALPIPRTQYVKVLDDSDYVIFNGFYEPVELQNVLSNYLQENKDTVVKVGRPLGYQAIVVKLKPLSERSFK